MKMCSHSQMQELLDAIACDHGDQIELCERLVESFPDDARLHFLRGSLLAGSARPIEAHLSLSKAVALDPDYHIARFQLGFFELTSGEEERAIETWRLLHKLEDGHYLKYFYEGLELLVKDQFTEAADTLKAGILANEDNPLLNRDIQLIVDQCDKIIGKERPETSVDEVSATSLFLDRLSSSNSTH